MEQPAQEVVTRSPVQITLIGRWIIKRFYSHHRDAVQAGVKLTPLEHSVLALNLVTLDPLLSSDKQRENRGKLLRVNLSEPEGKPRFVTNSRQCCGLFSLCWSCLFCVPKIDHRTLCICEQKSDVSSVFTLMCQEHCRCKFNRGLWTCLGLSWDSVF